MTDRLAELGALRYAAENTATHATSPNRLASAGYLHAAFSEYQIWAAANPGVNPCRLSARGRIFGYFYDNATFSPLSLFASGEQGAWYDPSDLSTMFQDAAGTTPVTADGQPVGKILDKSGRGNHASQATAASRPLYKTDGTYHWLQFDGVDDSLSTAEINFTSTDKMSVFAGTFVAAANTDQCLVATGPSNPGTFTVSLQLSGGANRAYFPVFGTTYSRADAPFTALAKRVLECAFDLSTNSMGFRVNTDPVSVTGSTGTGGVFANRSMIIGNNQIVQYFNGNIYSLIVRGALSTLQEITDTETWLNGKTGAF